MTRIPIKKSPQMRAIEEAHGGTDIRDIVLDYIQKIEHEQGVAQKLGIQASTLSHWIPKMGIWAEVEQLRAQKRINKVEDAKNEIRDRISGKNPANSGGFP